MKNPKLGDYLLWKGKPAQIKWESSDRQVGIVMLENKKCPHCGGDLGDDVHEVIVSSPLFQENAEPLPTLKDHE